jgi:transposase
MPTNRRTPSTAQPPRLTQEQRRLRAGELFAQGRSQAEVAKQLGVSRQSAKRWHDRWRAGGAQALRSRGRSGRPPRIRDDQLATIEQALLEGARAHGFDSDLWTMGRVARVVKRLTGIGLPSTSTWRLLHQRLGWTVQRPERKAKERDEDAIARWVTHEWPRIKKGPAQNPPGLSSSTNRPSR